MRKENRLKDEKNEKNEITSFQLQVKLSSQETGPRSG